MPDLIAWTFRVQVQNGPTLNAAGNLPTDLNAYQKIHVNIPKDGVEVVALKGGFALLVVAADRYNDTDPSLLISLQIDAAVDKITLSAPLLLIGKDVVKHFIGAATLTSLTLTNGLSAPVTFDILTARHATTP